jgi:hypothetical protein
MRIQRSPYLRVGHIVDCGSAHDDEIHRWHFGLCGTKALPDEAFDAISRNCAAGAFSRDR